MYTCDFFNQRLGYQYYVHMLCKIISPCSKGTLASYSGKYRRLKQYMWFLFERLFSVFSDYASAELSPSTQTYLLFLNSAASSSRDLLPFSSRPLQFDGMGRSESQLPQNIDQPNDAVTQRTLDSRTRTSDMFQTGLQSPYW